MLNFFVSSFLFVGHLNRQILMSLHRWLLGWAYCVNSALRQSGGNYCLMRSTLCRPKILFTAWLYWRNGCHPLASGDLAQGMGMQGLLMAVCWACWGVFVRLWVRGGLNSKIMVEGRVFLAFFALGQLLRCINCFFLSKNLYFNFYSW